MKKHITRRGFLKGCTALTAGSLLASQDKSNDSIQNIDSGNSSPEIRIDPAPRFEVSPYMYMQFMEPLGNTDGSVEASWDYDRENWREDLVDVVKDLSPDAIRWGGAFIRYYKWKEGVGPPEKRPWMYNYIWGGKETNRVGTGEFNDFCRRVGAEPLMCVNLLSDGVKYYWNTIHGENRSADHKEAADWVSYSNDPGNRARISHGHKDPFNIKLWQLGNENSYLYEDGFSLEESAGHCLRFARSMKERDPSIKIIGWGDVRNPEKLRPDTPKDDPEIQFWAPEMLKTAGEYMDYIAIHMMGIYPKDRSRITGFEYQKDPEEAWNTLLKLSDIADYRIRALTNVLKHSYPNIGIAVTEGHLSLHPYNANMILTEWLSAGYHARTLNTYLRHGDRIKICTAADFCGTRWTVNAVMMAVPRGISFLLPVASIMRLYKQHLGTHGIQVESAPEGLDVTATRKGSTIYLHVLNMNYNQTIRAIFSVKGADLAKGRVYELAPENPREYVNQNRPEVFLPKEKNVKSRTPVEWNFPARSVSAVELDLKV
jgi:alpha-L-arabinofuranosidase